MAMEQENRVWHQIPGFLRIFKGIWLAAAFQFTINVTFKTEAGLLAAYWILFFVAWLLYYLSVKYVDRLYLRYHGEPPGLGKVLVDEYNCMVSSPRKPKPTIDAENKLEQRGRSVAAVIHAQDAKLGAPAKISRFVPGRRRYARQLVRFNRPTSRGSKGD